MIKIPSAPVKLEDLLAQTLTRSTSTASTEYAILEANNKNILGRTLNNAFILESTDVASCKTVDEILANAVALAAVIANWGACISTSVVGRVSTLFGDVFPYGLFGGGTTGSVTAYTDKYTYSNNVVAPGTVLGLARTVLAACGNSTVGIFGGGITDTSQLGTERNYTDKYTYSTNVVSVGTVLGLARGFLAATGNSTVGIFGGGSRSQYSDYYTYTDKYTYSNNVVEVGTVLGLGRSFLTACGNSTVGIFGGGYGGGSYSAYTDKYTYSNNVVAAGTVLGLARRYMGSCGNSTVCIFGGGEAGVVSSYTDKYTYATNVVSVGTILGLARQSPAATGNSTVGIFGGGYGSGYSAYTDKYIFSTDVVIQGTNLGLERSSLAATSSQPGGF